jgi:hypothetical protein
MSVTEPMDLIKSAAPNIQMPKNFHLRLAAYMKESALGVGSNLASLEVERALGLNGSHFISIVFRLSTFLIEKKSAAE